MVRADDNGQLLEVVKAGPHRVLPVCRHFGVCGGCALQHLDDKTYRDFKRDQVARALSQRGIANAAIEAPVSVAPKTRRRAALKARKQDGEIHLGFNARASHVVVDLHECHVLTPELFALAGKLRPLMHMILKEAQEASLHITEADNGFDLLLQMTRAVTPALTSYFAKYADRLGLIRVTAGAEPVVEFEAPRLRIANHVVHPPPDAFLQPTRESEKFLQSYACAHLQGAKSIADLFCGIGTFALALVGRSKVRAFDSGTGMIAALAAAARGAKGLKPIVAERRDLFRRPLIAGELHAFDAVVLDPPRAGAAMQVAEIAKSKVARVVYVSCNPASFARDAKVLLDGGFRLGSVTPLDQFLWSSQLEVAAVFEK